MATIEQRTLAYRICTALVAFFMISGGLANTFLQLSIAGLVKLGYPAYFARILGFWKVLGGIAILVPRFPRLKEWAYAGMTFELTGAAVTDAVAGDMGAPLGYAGHIAAPLVIAALAIASWALRPQNRVLNGAIPGWLKSKRRPTLTRGADRSGVIFTEPGPVPAR